MKAFHTSLLALAAAFSCGAAVAQLKLPSQTAPTGVAPRPSLPAASQAATSGPTAAQTAEAKEKAEQATLAASGWLLLLDRRDWGRAWETSASMFRSSVPLANWMDNIPKARDLGDFISRERKEAIYKPTLEGRPNGDYVTILFASKFSKKADVAEIVTTVRDTDGKWRVTGYSTR